MTENNELTIILVLKDRTPFTWRWFEFYNQYPLPYKVLVADGGRDKEVEKLADKSLFSNVDYEYLRYPYDKDTQTWFKKTCDALSKVQTKYVLLASNDDFYLENSIKNAVNFLNRHLDYVSARGEIYSLEIKGEIHDSDVYGKIVNYERLYFDDSITADTALERVKIFSQFSNSLGHDVCRTKAVRQAYQNLVESEISDPQHAERLRNYILTANGKVYRGPGLHMLHQAVSSGVGLKITRRSPFEWILSDSWAEELLKVINFTARRVVELDKIPSESARNKIFQYYLGYSLAENIIANRIKREIESGSKNIFRLSHFLDKNNPVRKTLKKIYLNIKRAREISEVKKRIKSSPSYKEIKLVEDFLSKKK